MRTLINLPTVSLVTFSGDHLGMVYSLEAARKYARDYGYTIHSIEQSLVVCRVYLVKNEGN